ncbi:SRPBCC family protein [Anabaena azotica]|uniref:SRPBCC family protein n=1 Tax=Anabaena azotica TaxID=197653 RepID=UPI0039A4E7A4
MTEYNFVTTWIIDAPIEKVWSEIINYPNWPTWWKYVERVISIQDYHRFIWKTPLAYKLAFDIKLIRVEPPNVLELMAKGDVDGVGLWELESIESGTLVRYTWKVKTTKAWMNILAIFLRPLMEWNHNAIMEEGGKALAQRLGAKLISAKS